MSKIFFSYSHADEELADMLQKHLAAMKNNGLITTWHDRCIRAGDEFSQEIDKNLNDADVILLLISSDFIASRYCYEIEMARAIERHKAREARVIPVILRPCYWHDTPFGKFLAAPKDGKPVRKWPDLDEAFLDVVNAIKAGINELDMNCPSCQKEVSKSAKNCPSCGEVIVKPKRSFFGKLVMWILWGFNVLMVALWVGTQNAVETSRGLISCVKAVGAAIWVDTQNAVETSRGLISCVEAVGAAIGTGIGVTLLVIIWLIGTIILVIMAMLTRPK